MVNRAAGGWATRTKCQRVGDGTLGGLASSPSIEANFLLYPPPLESAPISSRRSNRSCRDPCHQAIPPGSCSSGLHISAGNIPAPMGSPLKYEDHGTANGRRNSACAWGLAGPFGPGCSRARMSSHTSGRRGAFRAIALGPGTGYLYRRRSRLCLSTGCRAPGGNRPATGPSSALSGSRTRSSLSRPATRWNLCT